MATESLSITPSQQDVTKKRALNSAEVIISLGLFLLALLPRAYDLDRFATADEAKWVYRSAQFLAAFLNGDYAATNVNLTPAVTTTWLGSLGLTLYYWLNQATINLPFTDWLRSLPPFRADMPLLVATRWPMVLLTSLGVVILYWLSRQLFGRLVAVLAAVFIALDPHTTALSRILGHDAPAAMFMIISLLLLLLVVKNAGAQGRRGAEETSPSLPHSPAPLLFMLSGLTAGLAFLSKAPALFLIPFTGLVFVWQVWINKTSFVFWLKQFLLWMAIAYLTFVVVWPAAWVNSAKQPWAVIENAFLSATDQEEADTENYWLVPNLGPAYYLVHGGFKLSPMVMVGLVLALSLSLKKQKGHLPNNQTTSKPHFPPVLSEAEESLPHTEQSLSIPHPPTPNPKSQTPNHQITWLLAFAALFTLFMTLGDKRSPRYILPIFPALSIIAAYGWFKLFQVASSRWQVASTRHAPRLTPYALRISYAVILISIAITSLAPYAPYYFTYFNPLLGGSFTAPNLVKLGWGEGLDQVGRFLQREHQNSRVGTAYTSTVAPFFKGDISGPTGDRLDYVVLYTKQVQSGEPDPAFIRYYEQEGAIFSVTLNGITYAHVYPGPAIQPAPAAQVESSHPPNPIGFRPLTPYGHIGKLFEVDVLWPGNDIPASPVTITLKPNAESIASVEPVKAAGVPTPLADGLVVSRHKFTLPDDLARGKYTLWLEEKPVGEVELRRFQTPANMGPVRDVVFDNQIAVTGYQFNPTEDFIEVDIAWQAQKSHLPDYTVFVQLLDAESNERVAGADSQPAEGTWPTSRWVKGEVVIDKHLVAVPYGMPPGHYKVIVGLYQPETGQRLTLLDGQDHWALPWLFIRKE